ncbi:protein lin-52 homolog [Pieris rapae]|uniref:protein lin-52 homolog n=1 Tax=Pieris rapae TaxID=64459 RepID=UPI001E280B7F|nr:protein lin-52 homolog [Pieris rapae]
MAAKPTSQSSAEQTASADIPLTCLEESLLSFEKLDRASPELWPEQIPGVSEFAPLQSPSQSPPSWNSGLTKDDMNFIQQLGSLSTIGLIMEVKKLHDVAYQLGLEEAKEMTRGKYLNIFSRKSRP